jgi:hypothetical protein
MVLQTLKAIEGNRTVQFQSIDKQKRKILSSGLKEVKQIQLFGFCRTDGRYYVIDTARVLPPFPPNKTITAFVIPKGNSFAIFILSLDLVSYSLSLSLSLSRSRSDPPTHQLWANLSPIQVIDLPLKGWRNHVKKHFSVELQTNGLQEDFSSGFFVFSVPFKVRSSSFEYFSKLKEKRDKFEHLIKIFV